MEAPAHAPGHGAGEDQPAGSPQGAAGDGDAVPRPDDAAGQRAQVDGATRSSALPVSRLTSHLDSCTRALCAGAGIRVRARGYAARGRERYTEFARRATEPSVT